MKVLGFPLHTVCSQNIATLLKAPFQSHLNLAPDRHQVVVGDRTAAWHAHLVVPLTRLAWRGRGVAYGVAWRRPTYGTTPAHLQHYCGDGRTPHDAHGGMAFTYVPAPPWTTRRWRGRGWTTISARCHLTLSFRHFTLYRTAATALHTQTLLLPGDGRCHAPTTDAHTPPLLSAATRIPHFLGAR